jgi:hypothetical protein
VIKKALPPFLALLFAAFIGTSCFAQNDFTGMQNVPSQNGTDGHYQRLAPLSIQSAPDFLNSSDATNNGTDIKGNPGGLANIVSIPNFSSSLTVGGQTFPFTMMGNDPTLGHKTDIPTHIVAVSLELQNADLVSTTTVPVAPFEQLTLNSPNFEPADFTSGNNLQFADAVQRAEFFNMMKQNWHTNLNPATIVDHITVQIPRFVTVTLNGTPTQVRTYFTGQAPDGSTFVLLLNRFFNQAIFDLVNNEINAGNYTTNAMNIALFPNTFLFSLSSSGGIGGCCTLGFHTFFFDPSSTPQSRWVFAYASWISPGLFRGGFEDVTALSHEISESFNDPFVNNIVPKWTFPGEPGACQGNLETGDPVEVLANGTVAVPIKELSNTFTYHPQTEALLQWFEQGSTSNALGGAFSYPDTSALTTSAVPCQ